MLNKRQFLQATSACGLSAALPSFGQDAAATYPSKPIRLVVAFPPGGGADLMARIVAEGLSKALGQAVVVDNRPGASGIVSAQAVLSAPRDGYTLLVGGSGPMVFATITQRKSLPYDPMKDFSPITLLGSYANVIVARTGLPVTDARSLVDLARARPGKLSYGHPGVTFQVPMEAFLQDAGITMASVPYKGGAPMAADLMANQIDFCISDITSMRNLHDAGKIRIVAVTTSKRLPFLPEVPTLHEQGFLKHLEPTSFTSLNAPAGVPPAIITKLHTEISKLLSVPVTRQRLEDMAITVGGETPEATLDRYKREIALYTPVAEKAGLIEK